MYISVKIHNRLSKTHATSCFISIPSTYDSNPEIHRLHTQYIGGFSGSGTNLVKTWLSRNLNICLEYVYAKYMYVTITLILINIPRFF